MIDPKDKVRAATEKFIYVAYAAKDHLSIANYRERDAEATLWLREAEEELRQALLSEQGEGRHGSLGDPAASINKEE